MFKIKIISHSNIFYLKKMKFLLYLTILILKIFKLYKYFFFDIMLFNIYKIIYISCYFLKKIFFNYKFNL